MRLRPPLLAARVASRDTHTTLLTDRTAWIVPTHRPHFAFARGLADGVRDHGLAVDLHFVVGDGTERAAFEAELGDGHQAAVLALDDLVPAGRLASYLAVGSIINAKKFAGLHAVLDHYDVLCTLDSETEVLTHGEVRTSHGLRAERRAFPAHAVDRPDMRAIVQAPARLLGLAAEDRIMRQVTAGGRLYAWFEDVPTYDRDALGEMLERVGAAGDITVLCDRLSWFDFDHIIYQYFCCVFRDWHLEDQGWPAPEEKGGWWELWSLEQDADRERARAFGQRWAPSWVHDPALRAEIPSAFLAFHRDRLARGPEPDAPAETV